MIIVDTVATGKNINRFRLDANLSVRDVQKACLLSTPTCVYRWIHGESLPTLDNLVILAVLLNVKLDDIIVTKND